MGKKTSVWLIEALTNLHVGNESMVNFSVIDKAIQRDAVTALPCINSSSLKGAVKEFVTSESGMPEDKVINIFGSIKKKDVDITQKGSAIFFDANLLCIPKPCSGKFYELLTCVSLLEAFFKKAEALGYKGSVETLFKRVKPLDNKEGSEIEIQKLLVKAQGKKFDEFASLCDDDSLPIIARNCLENGESVNLWYEQVLPSKSILGAIIQTDEGNTLEILNGKVIQIGANATIGYGYCKFTKL